MRNKWCNHSNGQIGQTNQIGNMVAGVPLQKGEEWVELVTLKMFEKLKGKVHMANENGLTILLKI